MHAAHVDNLDLNLLPPLIALLDERHVSRAARRIGLSQPAMSRTLARLRRQFDDELLIRGPQGYSLTPRAERLRIKLAGVAVSLEQLFEDGPFDPAAAVRSFRIAMTDYTFPMFGPALVHTVMAQSPGSAISCEPLDRYGVEKLDAGSLDLLLYGRTVPERYRHRDLFTDRFVCVVAAEHPAARLTTLSMAQYVRWPHLAIDIGRTGIDRALHAHGQTRRTVVSMPYHALAASTLPGTDLVLTLAGRLASHFADSASTRILGAPPELGVLRFTSVWHPRLEADPAHRWLRHIVHDVAAGLDAPGDTSPAPPVNRS